MVLKSGNLNLLEPSGPVKACNGIALPYHTVNTPLLTSLGAFVVTEFIEVYWGS
jgi:hypothetical protein